MTPALEVAHLSKTFAARRGPFGLLGRSVVHAVDDVSFSVGAARTLALVGESGCGKTTIGRMVVRLTAPSAGCITVEGEDFTRLKGEALRRKRQRVQMVFQDPFACLNARMTGEAIVAEPLVNFGLGDAAARRRRVCRLFDQVGLITVNSDGADVDELSLLAIDAGAEDIRTDGEEGMIEIVTAPSELKAVQDALAAQGLKIEDAQITMQPKAMLSLTEDIQIKGMRLIERLEDLDDVQEVYTNLEISDEVLAQV